MKGSQDVTEGTENPGMFDETGAVVLPHSEVLRFYSEVGRDVVELARMLRAPTETRPFIYELRFDLWPASSLRGLAIIKGFGAEAGVIAFQEGSGLVGMLRGIHDRMKPGKVRFTPDGFPPNNYEKRFSAFIKDQEYMAAKLPTR